MLFDEFNQLDHDAAVEQLIGCCHCKAWAEAVAALRPMASVDELIACADNVWRGLDEKQVLEALSGHARIGDIALLRSRYAGKATREQGQVLNADDSVLQELYDLNVEYEQRHGFIFIVCATGKSAEEMLALLKARINNTREIELLNAALQQAEITRLRLQQLFENQEV